MLDILILHNIYRQAGGEDAVVRNEAAMLRRAGHTVTVETVSNDAIRSRVDAARAAWRAAYDPKRTNWMEALLDRVRPDIVHIHNFFPLLTPAVHEAAARFGAGVVQTLHNYRLLCAAATLERDGKICELCLGGSRWPALRHRCYRDSLSGTWAVTRLQGRALDRAVLTDNVDRFIALTEFSRSKFLQGGLPADKIAVKPNFLPGPISPKGEVARSGALYVGRLSHEKGVTNLIEAWRDVPGIPLVVCGDGPLRGELEKRAPANVTFLGQIDAVQIGRAMARASVMIVPSVWYEGFPMTIAEAFASGLPVIASRIGSLAEIVEDNVNGLHCEAGSASSLRDTVRGFFDRPDLAEHMGKQARRAFEELYSESRNLAMLEEIYEQAIAARTGPL